MKEKSRDDTRVAQEQKELEKSMKGKSQDDARVAQEQKELIKANWTRTE